MCIKIKIQIKKREVSKFTKHNFWNTDNSEAATTFPQKRNRSQKFHYTHNKTSAPESLRNKFAGPQARNFIEKRFHHRRPSVYTAKSARKTRILKNILK